MKRWICALFALLFLLMLCGCNKPVTEEQARKRLEAYAHAVDYDYKQPEKIYPFLCEEVRNQLSCSEFVECWKKERTYPYLTPLYIYNPVLTMDADKKSGTAVFTQAARIDGMTYEVPFVYENGDYYVCDWYSFADGSYLDKFDTVIQSIDWYFDPDSIEY